MNRAERRLAARLGVPFVARQGDWLEICLGGPGCGCGDEGQRGGPAERGGAAPRPAPDQDLEGEPKRPHVQPEG